VKPRPTADERAVVDSNMSGEQAVIYDDHAIPDPAIVPDVSADHEEIPIAENCRASFRRAAMDGAMLTNHVGIADLNSTFGLRLEGEILRCTSDDRAVSDEITGAHLYLSLNHHVRLDYALVPDNRLRPDNRKWADLDLGAELGPLVYDCCGVNSHSTPASLKLK
jgi:hypothetical protein